MDYGWYVTDYFNSFPKAADGASGINSKNYEDASSLAVQNTGDIFVAQLGSPAGVGANEVRFTGCKFQYHPDDGQTDTLNSTVEWYINDPNGGDPLKQTAKIMIDVDNGSDFYNSEYVTVDSQGFHFISLSQRLIDSGFMNDKNQFTFPKDAAGNHIGIPCIDDSQDIGSNLMFFNRGQNGFVPNDCITKDVTSVGMGDKLRGEPQGTFNFSITSKDYEPSELAQIISTQFESAPPQTAPGSSNFEITTNTMLTNTVALQELNTPNGGNSAPMPFVNLAGTQEFTFITAAGGANIAYNIGSSQFGLTFDEDSSKFELGSIHTSRYDSSGNQVVEGFINGAGAKKIMTNYSGIYIKALRPESLWIGDESTPNSMRFSDSILTAPTTKKLNIPGGAADQTITVPSNLTEGVNITGDLATLDSLILKKEDPGANNATGKAYDIGLVFGSYPPYRDAVNQVNGIFSQSAVDPAKQGNLGGGYYLVEIDMGIKQEFKSPKIHNNKIRGIVSRYYNNANYISGGAESGIIYEHKGEPVEISRLKVRILNPDGNLATDINDSSTIFLNYLTKK